MHNKQRRSYTGSTTLLKELNRSLVLEALRQEGSLTRTELAALTGLTVATVANIMEELLAQGYVQYEGQGESQGGRKPMLFSLVPDARQVIAVDVAVDRVTVALTDVLGRPQTRVVLPAPTGQPPRSVVDQVATSIQSLVTEQHQPTTLGIGVSFPGPTDVETGTVLAAPNLPGWEQVPLRDLLAEQLNFPVFVENDANAAALGERFRGVARRARNLIFLFLDLGIGGGFLLNGELYRGNQGAAGEVGHMIIDINGRRCGCGSNGCLETVASGIALTQRLAGRRRQTEPVLLEQLLSSVQAGDPQAKADLDEAARYIGVAAASLANIFNPELIVLGGRLAVAYPPFCRQVQAVAQPRFLPLIAHRTQVVPSSLGLDACLVGAASLVLEAVFRPLRLTSVAP